MGQTIFSDWFVLLKSVSLIEQVLVLPSVFLGIGSSTKMELRKLGLTMLLKPKRKVLEKAGLKYKELQRKTFIIVKNLKMNATMVY
jgi:hypothetical protein